MRPNYAQKRGPLVAHEETLRARRASFAAREWRDAALPGLILRVGARRRTWTFRARVGGVDRRDILGHFPAMSLSAAREAGRDLLSRLESGAPAPAPTPHPRAGSALTLGALLDRYEKLRLREGHRTKTLASAMRTLRTGLRPWLGLPAAEFAKGDLRAARDAIVERGALMQANRLLGYLGPVLRWAAQEDLIPTNFMPDLRKAPERKRDRVLSRAELAAIWHACDGGPVLRVARFTPLVHPPGPGPGRFQTRKL